MDLPFPDSGSDSRQRPLADRVRPRSLDEFVGQEKIVGPETLLRRSLETGRLSQSLILWGPPGCGKTTLARLIASSLDSRFVPFSAVTSGVADVKRVVAEARKLRSIEEQPPLLFVDEIHRFNKAQQDAFLPHVEDGTIVFIGATTENPSFEVIGPLLSRSRVLVLDALGLEQVQSILERALTAEHGLGGRYRVEEGALAFAADMSQGDARVALNALDYAASVLEKSKDKTITRDLLEQALQRRTVGTDKAGESHYNLISALHKSLRGSDVDASLYWLARMCEAGEDPLYVARRLVRFASEDVGVADPESLVQALAAKQAVEFVGYPECKLALAQAVVYLALAPKSNSLYKAYEQAAGTVLNSPPYPVPLAIRNAPTRLMKDLGYGKGYDYPHDHPDNIVDQAFLPEELQGKRFYHPKKYGFERDLAKRLEFFRNRRKKARED
jgi:putative ATPase